jgi:hypothetical protein
MTSSARASSCAGTSMPSVLAVLRLITISNFVGCNTVRKVSRLLALQDTTDIFASMLKDIRDAGAIAH